MSTLLPTVRAMIPAFVPSSANKTIRGRYTTFCCVLRSSDEFLEPLSIFRRNSDAFDRAHEARIVASPRFGNHPMRSEQ